MDRLITTILVGPFDAVVDRAVKALHRQGFALLAETDMQAVLRRGVGAYIPRYAILTTCNPALTHQCLRLDPRAGTLMLCAVAVREVEQGVLVEAVAPTRALTDGGPPALSGIADEAVRRLTAVVADIEKVIPAALADGHFASSPGWPAG